MLGTASGTRAVIVATLVTSVACGSAKSTESLTDRSGLLNIDTLVDIKHPERAAWSPNGRSVAFVWDQSGVQNVGIAAVSNGTAAQTNALTSYDAGLIDGIFWSRNGETVYFVRSGDLWRVGSGGDLPQAVWTTADVETDVVLSPDGTHVAFVRGGTLDTPPSQRNDGDLWVRNLEDDRETRLTNTPGLVEAAPLWSPDAARIAYTVTASKRHEESPAYSGVKILYTWLERSPSDVAVVLAGGGGSTPVAAGPDVETAPRWLDASRLVLERVTDRFRRRQIIVANVTTDEVRIIHEDVDAKWWSLPAQAAANPTPSPDGRWLAFVTDLERWDQLYIVPSSGGAPIRLTRGSYEAWRPTWSPDSTRIAFDANEEPEHPGSRHLGIVTLGGDPANAQVEFISSGRGTDIAPTWSPDGRRLLFQHTDSRNPADLYVVDASVGASAARLTDSLPTGVDRGAFVEPELVQYTAQDGEHVPAYLFVPKDLDRSKRHAAIVWIHGDGTNQNYDGWHVQRNYATYYSFHQYLVQRGYVVLAPDYRGSIGYGKQWRQGVYLDVGGKDSDDAAAGAEYLKTLAYVDAERIGVWGLSYGGFFTLQAMTRTPMRFRCGVDVAGTIDYRMYYDDPYRNGWTVGRMGTPDEHPDPYDVAAPIQRVDRLVRPLLVLHGTSDINVPYLHSVRLIDELLKRGKNVEFMMYPGEFHYFHRAHVLRDAWTRVERFFATHLRPGEP